jgi:hypothetical protein
MACAVELVDSVRYTHRSYTDLAVRKHVRLVESTTASVVDAPVVPSPATVAGMECLSVRLRRTHNVHDPKSTMFDLNAKQRTMYEQVSVARLPAAEHVISVYPMFGRADTPPIMCRQRPACACRWTGLCIGENCPSPKTTRTNTCAVGWRVNNDTRHTGRNVRGGHQR